MSDYDENSIQILSAKDAGKLFSYQKVLELSAKYPCSPPAFIEKLVVACKFADYPLDMAERRYLAKDYSVPVTEELLTIFKHQTAEQRLKTFGA